MLKFKIDLEFANAKDIRTNIDFLEKLYLIKLDEEKKDVNFDLLSIEQIPDEEIKTEKDEIIEDTGRDLCECGVSFIRRNKNRHYKSKTHQIFLNFKKS